MKRIILVLMLVFTTLAAGCSQGVSNDAKLTAAVTIMPQKAFVEAVAGDLAKVIVLVPKGASPETYEATPKQVEDFTNADVYFTMGLPSESSKLTPKNGAGKIVSLAESVSSVYPDRMFAEDSRDPHIWLSPKRAMSMVEEIARTFIELDPGNSELYMKNMESYLEKLQELDYETANLFQEAKGRDFIVYHPALGYFADDYGLSMHAMEEEGKEADPFHLIELIELAKTKGIKQVFVSDEVDFKQAASLAEEIGGQVVVIKILDSDYIGAMKDLAGKIAGEL